MTPNPLLEVSDLVKDYKSFGRTARVVDRVSFTVDRGEILALVGESGSGKTTTALCALGLEPATSGRIAFDGERIDEHGKASLRRFRRRAQMVFQDPNSSLNPRLRVGDIIREPLDIHQIGTREERNDRVADLLRRVGLAPTAMNRRPGQFSGGQQQRIGIARAIALEPELIVCDEPVSALDVSVQGQVINLFRSLQDELGLSYLFIAHDLAVVRHLAHRVAVMYLGTIAEIGTRSQVFGTPRHPYSAALLSATPQPDPTQRRQRIVLRGEPSSPTDRRIGCPFVQRCWLADDRCLAERPLLNPVEQGHLVACHHPIRIEESDHV